MHSADEEDAGDADEPPDLPLRFSKLSHPRSDHQLMLGDLQSRSAHSKDSLLTRALASPELTPLSDGEAPHLTSDGGLTSPARTSTPSPPLPELPQSILPTLAASKDSPVSELPVQQPARTQVLGVDRAEESKVEEGLGRRRCISFACLQKTPSNKKMGTSPPPQAKADEATEATKPQKRPCMLRFVCPTRPGRTQVPETTKAEPERSPPLLLSPKAVKPQITSEVPIIAAVSPDVVSEDAATPRQGSNATSKAAAITPNEAEVISKKVDRSHPFNRVDYQKCEATRFHEFGGSFAEDDEWTKEQTVYRQKITIDDTLRKENAIRQIAEEAEAEALEEENEAYDAKSDVEELEDPSDDGNETDDEEGFADSDDESDTESMYQFWTPGLTTAATSTDHMDHIRPTTHRLGSESSIDATLDLKEKLEKAGLGDSKPLRDGVRRRRSHQGHSDTADFPDSSDFVVGTIDEDRPLEDEYLSRRKRREQLKHKVIPQDIDPSFPNSDPEADKDEEEEDDEVEEEPERRPSRGVTADPASADSSSLDEDGSESETSHAPEGSVQGRHSPPKRLRSPPPPSSNRLFGRNPHRLRSPPPMHRKLTSPPSSRRPSPNGSLPQSQAVPISRLAQRPNLTHTTSLPRTPNPFWVQSRKSGFYGSESPPAGEPFPNSLPSGLQVHNRGPIDIIQGLENKRQRRKEKYWRQHCKIMHAGKEKERKCRSGKGAQRMREVGLEMADRVKGYKHDAQVVLSI